MEQELEEDVTCSVCKEIFQDPRILKCHHTICAACTKELTKEGKVKCPICRATSLSRGIVTDFRIAGLIDKLRKRSATGIKCFECEDATKVITFFCKQCELHFCNKCSKEHQQRYIFHENATLPVNIFNKQKKYNEFNHFLYEL